MFDSFQQIFLDSVDKTVLVANINTDLLGGSVYKYILSKNDIIKLYINKMINSANQSQSTKPDEIYKNEIISSLKLPFFIIYV